MVTVLNPYLCSYRFLLSSFYTILILNLVGPIGPIVLYRPIDDNYQLSLEYYIVNDK